MVLYSKNYDTVCSVCSSSNREFSTVPSLSVATQSNRRYVRVKPVVASPEVIGMNTRFDVMMYLIQKLDSLKIFSNFFRNLIYQKYSVKSIQRENY